MSRVYDIVSKAGRIPLDELVLRSTLSPEAVSEEVVALEREGIISIKGVMPAPADLSTKGRDTIVMLTSKGISANTA